MTDEFWVSEAAALAVTTPLVDERTADGDHGAENDAATDRDEDAVAVAVAVAEPVLDADALGELTLRVCVADAIADSVTVALSVGAALVVGDELPLLEPTETVASAVVVEDAVEDEVAVDVAFAEEVLVDVADRVSDIDATGDIEIGAVRVSDESAAADDTAFNDFVPTADTRLDAEREVAVVSVAVGAAERDADVVTVAVPVALDDFVDDAVAVPVLVGDADLDSVDAAENVEFAADLVAETRGDELPDTLVLLVRVALGDKDGVDDADVDFDADDVAVDVPDAVAVALDVVDCAALRETVRTADAVRFGDALGMLTVGREELLGRLDGENGDREPLDVADAERDMTDGVGVKDALADPDKDAFAVRDAVTRAENDIDADAVDDRDGRTLNEDVGLRVPPTWLADELLDGDAVDDGDPLLLDDELDVRVARVDTVPVAVDDDVRVADDVAVDVLDIDADFESIENVGRDVTDGDVVDVVERVGSCDRTGDFVGRDKADTDAMDRAETVGRAEPVDVEDGATPESTRPRRSPLLLVAAAKIAGDVAPPADASSTAAQSAAAMLRNRMKTPIRMGGKGTRAPPPLVGGIFESVVGGGTGSRGGLPAASGAVSPDTVIVDRRRRLLVLPKASRR